MKKNLFHILYFISLCITLTTLTAACEQSEELSINSSVNKEKSQIQNQADVVITNAFIPYRADSQKHFAAYFDLQNLNNQPIEVIDAFSPAFANVSLHETVFSDGMARMQHLEKLGLSSGETIHFKPKGKHVMLMQPQFDFSNMSGIYLILELSDGQKLKYEIDFIKKGNK